MEAAPLTAAHALARDAMHNAPDSALAAAEKHKAAALEFSKAADGVDDAEALRVLNLLEQHHQRLAQIVSLGSERISANESAKDTDNGEQSAQPLPLDTGSDTSIPKSVSHVMGLGAQPLPSPSTQRRTPRELSSSIASNLATARGIPSNQHRMPGQPPLPIVKNERKESNFAARTPNLKSGVHESQNQRSSVINPSSNAVPQTDKADLARSEGKVTAERPSDDPFQKFYATFEGLLTKLSAPLAFAGLPLVPEEPAHEAKPGLPANVAKPLNNTDLISTSPEISKIFSKAALRAVKEEHGGPGVQESFLVVPTGGGTVSYAGILTGAERQAREHSTETPLEHVEEGAEHFVDAREIPDMRSSRTMQRVAAISGGPAPGPKTAEELRVENNSLKQLTDNLSRRLYMWEKSAQSQSMALQQSIRNLQPPSRMPSDGQGDEKNSPERDERFRELEEQFTAAQRELERYGKENEKLRTVVMRYRERWEKLKEGARVRREGAERGAETPPVNEA